MKIIGALIKRDNNGVKFAQTWFKTISHEQSQTSLVLAMEDHESMEALGRARDSQLSYTESESNSSSTCCSSSLSTKTAILLDHLRVPADISKKRKVGVSSAPPKGKK